MFDQRDLSIQIVQAKGDYLWTVYLDFTLVDPSTTFNTKLPPVQAHSVYHPMSRPSPSGAPLRYAALTWGGAWSLARTGRGRGRGAAADG